MWAGVPQCGRMFPSVRGRSPVLHVIAFVTPHHLSATTSSFQQVVQVCFMMEERCGYVQDIFDTLKEQKKLFIGLTFMHLYAL